MSSFVTLRRSGYALGLGTVLLFSLTHCGDEPGTAPDTQDAPDAGADARREPKPPQEEEEAGLPALPPSLTEGGGTRFRPEYREETYEDGARRRIFTGAFLDTQANRRCVVDPVGADRWACVPTDVAWAQPGFRDASCTEPVLLESGSPETTPYLAWTESCSLHIGPKTRTPTMGTAYTLDDGQCLPRFGVAIHERPTEIEPSALGEFTRATMKSDLPSEQSGSRLAIFTDKLVGPDGSFQYRDPVVRDVERGVEGGVHPGQDGKHHFLPAVRWASESLGFVDAACTETLVNLAPLPPATCGATRPPNTNALQYVGDHPVRHCRAVRAVGAPTKPVVPDVYLESGGTCSLMKYPGTDTYTKDSFTELPASESPEAARSIVPHDAVAKHGSKIEFRAAKTTSPDGLDVVGRDAQPYLRELGVRCTPMLTSDGAYRCLPSPALAYAGSLFSDGACTQKVLRFEDWRLPCDGDPTLYVIATLEAPGYVHQVFRRPASPPLNQTTYYSHAGDGSCVPVEASRGDHYYAVTAADEPIPSTEFPAATETFVVDR